jgi:hypothetical protein
MRFVLLAMLMTFAVDGAAAIASGRNWSISIGSLQCDAAGSQLAISMRLRYLGPKGAVEAPVHELIGEGGRQIRPRSLVWGGGPKELARWLPSGGVAKVLQEHAGDVLLKFDLPEAKGGLQLAFGDIEAFPLTRKDAPATKRACENLLKLDELQLPRALPRPARTEKPNLRVYREAHPCLTPQGDLRTVEANQPPQHPLQMLLFGRDFLPNLRQVELPGGKVATRTYSYTGADALTPLEDEASRAIAADYGEYLAGLVTAPASTSKAKKFFAFNWGVQKSSSGKPLYPIAIYEVRRCTK